MGKGNSRDGLMTGFAVVSLVVIWCIGWHLTKLGLAHSKPLSFTAARFALGAVFLLIGYRVIHGRFWPTAENAPAIIIVGLLQTTLMYTLSAYGLLLVDLSRAVILIYATPIWTVAFGPLFLSERNSLRRVCCVVVGIVGVGVVIIPSIDRQPLAGFMVLLSASFAWALAMLLTKRNLMRAERAEIVAWQTTFGAIGLVILTPVVDGGFIFDVNVVSVISLLYVVLFGTVIATSIWFYVVRKIDVVQSSLVSLSVPVVVMVSDTFINKQTVDLGLAIGGTLIIASILSVWETPKVLGRPPSGRL